MAGSSSSSSGGAGSKGPQVFINFRGDELRLNFVDSLVVALKAASIKIFMDTYELAGRNLDHLLVRIDQSRVALAIFSKEYTTSAWCLDELVRIKERMDDGKLTGIPIFYKVDPSVVGNLDSDFGDKFRRLKRENQHDLVKTQKWEEALTYMTKIVGLHLREGSGQTDNNFIDKIVERVQAVLADIPREGNADSFMIYAKKIKIAHVDKPENWTWSSIHEAPNGEAIYIATLKVVYLLRITGFSLTNKLTPEKKYEVVFVVKVEEGADGWNEPVNLTLKMTMRDKTVILQQKETCFLDTYVGGEEWVDIKAGEFVAPPKEAPARIDFTMCQTDTTVMKTGLVVKGVAFRPVD